MHRTMMDRFPFLVFLLALFLVLLGGGGCAGGGGADAPSPTPTPVPTPDVELDIGILDGTWKGVSGSGTATGPDGTYTLKMTSASARLADTQARGDTGMTSLKSYSNYWDAYQEGMRTTSVKMWRPSGVLDIRRTASNTWELDLTSGQSKLELRLLSETELSVTEEGTFDVEHAHGSDTYGYVARYTLTKITIAPSQRDADRRTREAWAPRPGPLA